MSTQDETAHTDDAAQAPTTDADALTPAEQHRRAQETGEVFEGQRYGGR